MEKEELNRRRAFAESSANPKFRFSHVYCKRCGKPLYTPMPCSEDEEAWGVMAFVPLVIAYLHNNDWRTIKDGEFNGYYCCPDCLTEKDTDFKEPVQSANKALIRYKEWVGEMRKRYDYFN